METTTKRPRVRSRLVQLVYQVQIVKKTKEEHVIGKYADQRQHYFISKKINKFFDKVERYAMP